ncbi:MAG: hypothetical protein HC900_08595 [Methylacidiphilales bacterium]|nr:hypothetical protein [Candidatus Methylacidiphilales bacterium]
MTPTFKGRPEAIAGSRPTPCLGDSIFGTRNAGLTGRLSDVSSSMATRGAGPVTLIAV